MKTPTVDQVTAKLRKRIKQGDFTLNKAELKRIADMLDKLSYRCAEAYQVVGSLADETVADPAVTRALDLLSDPLRRGGMLPFATVEQKAEHAQPPRQTKRKSSPQAVAKRRRSR